MPVMEFGQTLKSPFLERWMPTAGTLATISILSLKPIGTRTHWVDYQQEAGIRSRCTCVDGICCKAFGSPMLSYNFPIWVYDKPGAIEGHFYVWSISSTQYRDLVNVAHAGDLLTFDLQIQVVQQGQGLRTSFTIMPGSQMRSLMPEDFKAKLKASVDDFYECEDQLATPMTPAAYNQLLMKLGYDFNSGMPLVKNNVQALSMGYYPNMAQPAGQLPPTGYPTAPAIGFNNPGMAPQEPLQTAPVVNAQTTPVAPVAPAAPVSPVQSVAPTAAPVPPVTPMPTPVVPLTAPVTPQELASMLES